MSQLHPSWRTITRFLQLVPVIKILAPVDLRHTQFRVPRFLTSLTKKVLLLFLKNRTEVIPVEMFVCYVVQLTCCTLWRTQKLSGIRMKGRKFGKVTRTTTRVDLLTISFFHISLCSYVIRFQRELMLKEAFRIPVRSRERTLW